MQKETYKPQKLYKNGAERTVTSAAQAAEARAEGWSDTKPVVASPTPTFPTTPYGVPESQEKPVEAKPVVANPFAARDAEPKPVTGSPEVGGGLPPDFPEREILVAAGLDTAEKVRGVFGDRVANPETVAQIQIALRRLFRAKES